MLSEQAAITVEGMDALVAWAGGEPAAAERLRLLEHEADEHKRELREALTEAFSTPLEPEDIFELSPGSTRSSTAPRTSSARPRRCTRLPTRPSPRWRRELADGTGGWPRRWRLFARGDAPARTGAADRAVKDQRHLQHSYRAGRCPR